MKDVIYRFRPIEKLLHDDGITGELDSLYIYFAGREQLNDPLEGYADFFFEGDEIAWNNLLKNYLQCLSNHCSLLALGQVDSYDLSRNILGIAANAPPGVVEIWNETYNVFMAEPTVAKFVSAWCLLGKAHRSELFSYLDTIHFYATDIITQMLSKKGLLPKVPARDEKKHAYRLERVRLFTEVLSNPNLDLVAKKEMMDVHVRYNKESSLLNRFQNRHREISQPYLEMIAFPDKYCNALEKSVYPEWYVACFMEECDDSSIWGSYGRNHTAVCLEFYVERTANAEGITLTRPNSIGSRGVGWGTDIMPLKAVSYGKDFASVDFFNSLGSLNEDSILKYWLGNTEKQLSSRAKDITENQEEWRLNYWKSFDHTATVKISHWKKEREYRLIQHSTLFDLTDTKLRKLNFEFSSLKGIVFGINTSVGDKLRLMAKIENLCKEHKRKDFHFYQARYDHHTKKIAHDHLSKINMGFSGQ